VPDPADFGTAFGLEMSLGEPASPQATAKANRPRWLDRLGLKPGR